MIRSQFRSNTANSTLNPHQYSIDMIEVNGRGFNVSAHIFDVSDFGSVVMLFASLQGDLSQFKRVWYGGGENYSDAYDALGKNIEANAP